MTDKQIIIDGVDVSECGHYHQGKCEIDYDEWNNEIIRYNECQNNPNCYYKQLQREKQNSQEARDTAIKEFNRAEKLKMLLKRKEQECEELKEDRERWKSNFNGKVSAIEELLQQLDQLETRNEELKKQLQAQRAFTRHEQKLIYCVAYDETCKTGNDCKQEKCIFKDNIKLKQTLTEIKGIAEEQIPYLNIDKAKTIIEVEYDYADKIYNLEQRMYKILQKISEVLKNEN